MATITENNGDAGATPETANYSMALGDNFQGTLEAVDDTDLIRIEISADTIYDVRLHFHTDNHAMFPVFFNQ